MRFTSLILIAYLYTLLISCNRKEVQPKFLSQNNLRSLKIQIRNDSSYTLKTGRGVTIKIEPGTFKISPESKIEIEIKEALSPTDILLAGLETTSNGKPLSSAGMIYFSASSNNKELEFNKQVSITVPTEKYDDKMQLFKGALAEDSSINWVEPKPLNSSAFTEKLKIGEQIFKANCANCHRVNSDFTGPALAGYLRRIPGGRKWIYAFVNNPAGMIARNAYAKWLADKWKPTIMTSFSNLKKYDVDAIMDYVDNESNTDYSADSVPASVLSDTSSFNLFAPECGYDTSFYFSNNDGRNDDLVEIKEPATQFSESNQMDTLKDGYKFTKPTMGIYSFGIDGNGWYNIDKLVEDKLESIELTAIIEGNKDRGLEVYLLIPGEKIMISSTMNKGNKYSFSQEDGVINLPINEKGIIIAIGSDNSDCYYGARSFILQKHQQIKIEVKKETPEKIKESIRNNNLNEIQIEPIKKKMEVVPRPCDDLLLNQSPAVAINTISLP